MFVTRAIHLSWAALLIVVGLLPHLAIAKIPPLVSPHWLQENLNQTALVVLDIQPRQYFERAHIPGAVHTDYGRWRITDDNGLGKMLPKPALLATLIGSHGIGNDSHVVIAPFGRGAGDMAAAARIYWTLYVAGLEQISILDGGLFTWYRAFGKEALESGFTPATAKAFEVRLRDEQLMPMDKVGEHLSAGRSLIDSRSVPEFVGQVAGAPNERPGALPKAVNLPYDSLMKPDDSGLLDLEQLKQRFRDAGAPLTGPQISYCHTGHRTSLVWFVSHALFGNDDARLYDGSTLEWSATESRPLVTRVASPTKR